MDPHSFLRSFLFGATFGFFYFFEVSIPLGPALVQDKNLPPIIQKSGSLYGVAEGRKMIRGKFTIMRAREVHLPSAYENRFEDKEIPIIESPRLRDR